jgi:hypothetical protein
MINTIKTAIASVEATLKALGLTKLSREDGMREDGSLDRLLSEEVKYNVPPTLEDEFLRFQEDIEGAVVSDSDTQPPNAAEKEAALSKIKKPIESYEEEQSDMEESDVIEADSSPVKQLG